MSWHLLSPGGCPDASLTSWGARQQDAGMQLLELPMQLLQAAVGGPEELLHVAQVAAVRGRPPQVLHSLLDFQLLLDGPADRLSLVLWGPPARPGLWGAEEQATQCPLPPASAHHTAGRGAGLAPRTRTGCGQHP